MPMLYVFRCANCGAATEPQPMAGQPDGWFMVGNPMPEWLCSAACLAAWAEGVADGTVPPPGLPPLPAEEPAG